MLVVQDQAQQTVKVDVIKFKPLSKMLILKDKEKVWRNSNSFICFMKPEQKYYVAYAKYPQVI